MKQKKWNWVVIFLAFVLAFTTVSPVEQIWADSSVEQESDITEPETEVPTDTQPNEEESAEPDDEDGTQEPEKKPVLKGLVRKNGKTFYYKNGKKITNSFKTVDGYKYYFGKSGKAGHCAGAGAGAGYVRRTAGGIQPKGQSDSDHRPRRHRGQALH